MLRTPTDGWSSSASPRRPIVHGDRHDHDHALNYDPDALAQPVDDLRASCSPTSSWSTRCEAGTIVAVMAAVVGWYMVLRRQSFAGHTIAVMSFPGAAGAALAGLPSALGYYLACGAARAAHARCAVLRPGATRRAARHRVGDDRHRAGRRAGARLPVPEPHTSGVLEQLETLLFGTFLGITAARC